MTIKEIEELTGMSRANIRYYEAEGLVVPERNRENGYRIYSRENVLALQKIKLLRSLDVPLEDVRQLQQGKDQLSAVLDRHLKTLAEKKDQLERSGEITRQIIEKEEAYATLDAARYLQALENGGNSLKQDVSPRLNLPWRRFWARDLDYMLCALLVNGIMHIFPYWDDLNFPFTLAAMLLLEPLCLSLFATTPGKAIFGIRVLNPEEGKLSYGDALVRTWTVLWEGEALRLPLVNIYFHYKAYTAVENDQTLAWEWDSDLSFKDDKNWRYVLYFAALAAVYALNYWLGTGG